MLEAAAFDLDVLQELSVDLEDLAVYVESMAPTASRYWANAGRQHVPTRAWG